MFHQVRSRLLFFCHHGRLSSSYFEGLVRCQQHYQENKAKTQVILKQRRLLFLMRLGCFGCSPRGVIIQAFFTTTVVDRFFTISILNVKQCYLKPIISYHQLLMFPYLQLYVILLWSDLRCLARASMPPA